MNIKQLEKNIENVKKYSPQIYKDTMNLSLPYFILHKKLFEEGESVILANSNINQSELDILAALYYISDESFILSPTQLMDTLVFSSGGMTKALKKLEEKKYIKRVDNKDDKRSKLVQITDIGKDITSKALKDIVDFEDKYFSKLDKDEQEQLKNLLYKMIK